MGLLGTKKTRGADIQNDDGSGQSTQTPSTFKNEKQTTPDNASTSEKAGKDATTPSE